MAKKVEQSPTYIEKKFDSLKLANAYARENRYKWYTSTLVLANGVDGVKQYAPGKSILVAIVGETSIVYYK